MRNLLALVAVAVLSLSPLSATGQTTTAQNTAANSSALGSLLEVLKDDEQRAQLIKELERVEAGKTPDAKDKAADQPSKSTTAEQPADTVVGNGLLTGVTTWLGDLAERLPTAALGAPIDVRLEQAQSQVSGRLDAPGAVTGLRSFLLYSAPGWAAITLLAFLSLWFVRRRTRARSAGRPTWAGFAREAGIRLGLAVVPLIVCFGVAFAWSRFVTDTTPGNVLFVMLTVPFAIALASSEIASCLMVLLSPTKGRHIVSYAQQKLSPLVGILVGMAAAGSLAITPQIRNAIGTATSDLLSLFLDLAVPVFALFIIVTHRRTVRALITKGHAPGEGASTLDRAIYWLGTRWHQFGVLFVILNIAARLLGGRSRGFLTQSSLSVLLIVLAFMAISAITRFGERRRAAVPRYRATIGVRRAIMTRLGAVVILAVQSAVVLGAAVLVLNLWGVDVVAWAGTDAGASIVKPVVSMGMVMLTAWTLWVVLDGWIAAALVPHETRMGAAQQSARLKTLLPLLRNVAFVVLSVLTVIGVLSNLGINVAPLIAGAGVVGLAVGFGSQQLVQDVITGLFMLLEDSLAIGDVIDTGDRSGTVEALTIRTVKIRDGDGALHSIPFSTVKALKNSSRGFGVYTASVTLSVDADVGEAIGVFRKVGDEVRQDPQFSGKILSPLDVWGVDSVGPDGVVIKGAIRTRPLQQYGVGREINRLMTLRLQEAGIPLASRSKIAMLPQIRSGEGTPAEAAAATA